MPCSGLVAYYFFCRLGRAWDSEIVSIKLVRVLASNYFIIRRPPPCPRSYLIFFVLVISEEIFYILKLYMRYFYLSIPKCFNFTKLMLLPFSELVRGPIQIDLWNFYVHFFSIVLSRGSQHNRLHICLGIAQVKALL